MVKEKGIVFENTSSYSIFLTEDGRFQKGIPDSLTVNVGDEISFRPYVEAIVLKQPKKTAYLAPLIAAVAIILMFFSVLIPSQSKVSAYVQVDINPSIEIGIDHKGDVQIFRGLNEDGKALKRDISFWKGKPLTWVLSKVIAESNIAFDSDDRFGITTIISEEKNQKELEKIITTALTQTTLKIAPENIEVNQATPEERIQANEKGVSVGTYKDTQQNVKPQEKVKEKPAISQPNEIKAKEKNKQNEKREHNKNRDQSNKQNSKNPKGNHGKQQVGKERKKNRDIQNNNQQKNNDVKLHEQKEQKWNREKHNNTQQRNKENNSIQSNSKSNDNRSSNEKDKEKENKREDERQNQKKSHQSNYHSKNKEENNKNSNEHNRTYEKQKDQKDNKNEHH